MLSAGRICCALLCLLLLIEPWGPSMGWTAPLAWLVNEEGNVAKLNLLQNVILETRDLGVDRILIKEIAIDQTRKHLYVPHGRPPYSIAVFDLVTLKRKGILDFRVNHAPTATSEAVRFIFPPSGGEVYVRWWNAAAAGGSGAFEVTTIDAGLLKTKRQLIPSPALADKLMVDTTGQKVYSLRQNRPARIDVFDLPSLVLTSTIDLEAYLSPAAFGRDIDGFGQGKVLLGENEKTVRSDPSRYTYFVYEISTGRVTPRIRTGARGSVVLLGRTNRILFDEEVVLKPGAQVIRRGDLIKQGRIHVYDTVTSTPLAILNIPADRYGEILAVSPAEDAFYYLSSGASQPRPKVSAVSLNTFATLKEMPLPIDAPRMVVFDE